MKRAEYNEYLYIRSSIRKSFCRNTDAGRLGS